MQRRTSIRTILALGLGGSMSARGEKSTSKIGAVSGSDPNNEIFRNAPIVDSIAALRAPRSNATSHVIVAGYHEPGDGGGGLYCYDAADKTSQDDGGAKVVATDGGRWKLANTLSISIRQFGAKGDNATDDSAAIQAAHTFAARNTHAGKFVVNGVSSSYHGTAPRIIYPKGRYLISREIDCGPYMIVDGDDAIIVQTSSAKRIFEGNNAYHWNVGGITFIGGSTQVHLANSNSDSTIWHFQNCSFVLSQDYAVITEALGGKYTHLSANLTFENCLWDRPKKVLLNCCDYASIKDSWIHVSKLNFGSNEDAFAILNKANSSHPRLYLENVTGVPEMGKVGIDRVAQARWIDNYGDVIAIRTRFGGENAGMGIIRHYKPPSTAYPFVPTQISLENCELYAGPSSQADSSVINCIEVPKIIRIKGCQGPIDVPYVIAPTLSFPAYFDAYATAARRAAWKHFKIDIDGNGGEFTEGLIHKQRIPLALRPFITKTKQAIVRRVLPQTISKGLTNNYIQFDTVDFENCDAFSLAAPTLLRVPFGATKARVSFSARLHGSFTGGTVSAHLLNNAQSIVVACNQTYASSPDGIGITLETDVFALPNESFQISVLQDSGAPTTIVQARATVTALDHVQ